MAIESVILYILSGYAIVSVLIIIKLLIKSNKLEVNSRVSASTCEKRLCSLEKRVKKHIEEDDKRLKKHMDRLEDIRKSIVSSLGIKIDSASIKTGDIKTNIRDLDMDFDEIDPPTSSSSSKEDDRDLLLG